MFAMKKLILAAFAIAAVVATSGNADASFAIRILNSSNTVVATVIDGQIIANVSDNPKLIDGDSSDVTRIAAKNATGTNSSTSVTIGSFSFRFSQFEGNYYDPTVSVAQLGINISALNAGKVSFEFTRDGYTFPTGGNRQVVDSLTANSSPQSNSVTVSYQSWITSGSNDFLQAGFSNGALTSTSPGSVGKTGVLFTTGNFSITTRTTFTFTGATSAGGVRFDGNTEVNPPANIVPAPAGLLLSLLGLPALALARRFRREVPAQA